MFLNNNNLHQFLTNNRSNSQTSNSNTTRIQNNSKIYNLSKSNININNIENSNKKINIFSNIMAKQKEKEIINISRFSKEDKNYYNNINLITEHNLNKKHIPKELNFSLLNMSKNAKGNSYKTLNYDRPSFIRIMKYFTIKSNKKPIKLDELSPVFIPIRNTLSNEHRKNTNMNMNSDNIKDKINFYYYINSKENGTQLFNGDKSNKNKNNKNNSSNNIQNNDIEFEGKNNIIINNSNNYSISCSNNKINNNINLINKNELRNSNFKNSDNNLTFSKNSNESEFTFKDKGSAIFNIDKKSNNKENGNDNIHNNINISHNSNLLNSELNSFTEKENKINNNKFSFINTFGKNNDISKISKNGSNRLSISIEKINNKEISEKVNDNINNNNIKFKYNYNIIKKEEKKANNNENPSKLLNEKLFNNFMNKENHEKINNLKSSNLLEKIINNQNIKLENDFISNEKINIDNEKNNNNKNNLKNSYQFRIRKINLPIGFNLDSIQHNNKLLQNIINKKSKKKKDALNPNNIFVAQTEYKMMQDDKNKQKKIK